MTIKIKESILDHYKSRDLYNKIISSLKKMGKDIDNLTIDDLAPVDAFHIRGRKSTEELLDWVDISSHHKVLDIGCALGGTSRFISSKTGCNIVGIDLIKEYCEVATQLSTKLKLAEKTSFINCDASNLPFKNNYFDFAWTEHVQMNIKDKTTFYSEISNALKNNGQLIFHDIFTGENFETKVKYPVPWASDSSISHLISFEAIKKILATQGFSIVKSEDMTSESIAFFRRVTKSMRSKKEFPFGIHLIMGDNTKEKFNNLLFNMENKKISIIQAVFKLSK